MERAAARRSGDARRPPTTATDAAASGGAGPATNSQAQGGSGGVAASGQPSSPESSSRSPSASSRAVAAPGSGLWARSRLAGSLSSANRVATAAGNGPGVAASDTITSRSPTSGVHHGGRPSPPVMDAPLVRRHSVGGTRGASGVSYELGLAGTDDRQVAEGEGLADVLVLDPVGVGQVGDRPGDPQGAVEPTGAEAEAVDGGHEGAAGGRHHPALGGHVGRRQAAVLGSLAGPLAGAGGQHPRAYRRRRLGVGRVGELLGGEPLGLDVQVDAVQ